ncbi:hypothetical protein IFR05_016084, partial [Cadophora sp. M221]
MFNSNSNSHPSGSGPGSGSNRRTPSKTPGGPSSGQMKGWAYVDENGNDVTEEHVGPTSTPTPSRAARSRAMAMASRENRENIRRASGFNRDIDTVMGGSGIGNGVEMDDTGESYPQGSM